MLARGDQIHRQMGLQHAYARVRARAGDQGLADRAPGGVGDVHHAPMAVATLLGQVEGRLLARIVDARETHAEPA